MAHLDAQRFRLLQKVNDLELIKSDFRHEQRNKLTPEQRTKLAGAMEAVGSISFSAIRKLLDVPKEVGINLEAGGESKLKGNRTNAVMLKALGERWNYFTREEKNKIVWKWIKTEEAEPLMEYAVNELKMEAEAAKKWAHKEPEDGYSRLSLKALKKILPAMENGVAFKTAETSIYGNRFSGGKTYDRLPPVRQAMEEQVLPSIPNPAVMRALTELRKVTNAIVRHYGKPHEIRLELARDIKKNAKQREDASKDMRGREKERDSAKKRLQEIGNPSPSRSDVEKDILYSECKGICVYCGNSLGTYANVFDGSLEKDHILPQNRFPDDSFANKLLVHRHCNQHKLGRTPYECWRSDPDTWNAIKERMYRINQEKWRRLSLKSDEELAEFSDRRLNDTRYATKLAADYLGQLYGGRDLQQAYGKAERKIFTSSGLATATLRRAWGLEKILREPEASANGQNPGKPRTDHRHHAIDAITIALTSNSAIKQLSDAAAKSDSARISGRNMPAPWPNFVDSIRPHIEQMNVSHRPDHKLTGQLHDETNYSPRRGDDSSIRVRKPLHALSARQIQEDIVDVKVRIAVQKKLAEIGDPKKFAIASNAPSLVTKAGARIPIRRARVRVIKKLRTIAQGARERHVEFYGNHHVSFFETGSGRSRKWEAFVTSRHEAMERQKSGKPIIHKELPHDVTGQYLFSLMGGDMVELDIKEERELYVLRTIGCSSEERIQFVMVRATDARKVTEMKAEKKHRKDVSVFLQPGADALRKMNCRKVEVNLLGMVHYVDGLENAERSAVAART